MEYKEKIKIKETFEAESSSLFFESFCIALRLEIISSPFLSCSLSWRISFV